MTLQQLHSLNEDELSILWYCVNKVNPPVLAGVDLEPSLFVSINHRKLMNKLTDCRLMIKPEHLQVFDGLMDKLRLP